MSKIKKYKNYSGRYEKTKKEIAHEKQQMKFRNGDQGFMADINKARRER